MTVTKRRRALLGRLAVLLGLSVFLVAAPIPNYRFEPIASASTVEPPRLEPSNGSELSVIGQPGVAISTSRLKGRSEDVRPFSMIGLTAECRPSEPVLVRVRDERGRWSGWTELGTEDGEGPDSVSPEYASSRAAVQTFATEPLWVGSADSYEISVGADDVCEARVVVVREGIQRVVADATPLAGAAVAPIEGMGLRSSWGARAPKRAAAVAASVKLAVVHHSDGSNDYTQGQVPAILRSVQAFHMDGRGWDDIAYNFIVDKFGGIWEGRAGGVDKAVVGAHAAGFNTGSVGVMVIGSYTSVQSTAAARESVSHVIGWKLAQHGVDPGSRVSFTSAGSPRYAAGVTVDLPRVVGHGDVGRTTCPGTLESHLGAIQGRSRDYFRWYRAVFTPIGALDAVTGGKATVTATGWAIDNSSADSTKVRITVDSAAKLVSTDIPRSDVAAIHGGDGSAGFSASIAGVGPGMRKVCATVVSGVGSDLSMGCKRALVADPADDSPVGGFDLTTTEPGHIHVRGWALDPNTSWPTTIDYFVDGVNRGTGLADLPSRSVPPEREGLLGSAHGFGGTIPGVLAGRREICVRARNIAAGQDSLIDCRVVTVPAHSPIGALEAVRSTKPGKIDVSGWALDFEKPTGIYVIIEVGDRRHSIGANRPHAGVAARYPLYGNLHGFGSTLDADGGRQKVCAWGVNVGGGSDALLGCRAVDVVK